MNVILSEAKDLLLFFENKKQILRRLRLLRMTPMTTCHG
jgi:hypothetical protein